MIREIKSWFRKVFNRVFSRSISDPSEGYSKGLSKGLSKSEIRAEIKEREAHILHILEKYKHNGRYEGKSCYVISSFKNGLNYRDPSTDVCVKVIILGKYSADAESAKHYSYPDIDMTKTGTVCSEELTGRIYDFDSWTIFYKNEPHTRYARVRSTSWVSLLDYEERVYYSIAAQSREASSCMSRNVDTMDELYEKFKVFLSKEDLRDIRLKELGI